MPRRSKAKIVTEAAKILIVDDHPLVRAGLKDLISSQPDMVVCGEAATAAEALKLVDQEEPDLVVIDLKLKQSSGIELIKQIKARYKGVKMLVSSMHEEALFAERALHAGASGYINKEEASEKVIEAIRQILDGKVYLSNRMTEHMLYQFAGRQAEPSENSLDKLSNRELEVFELVGQGLGTRQIADLLHLSVKTIETYRESVKRKLNLNTSSELIRRAVQWVLEGK
jgi:DNA-binding NarL/FixJ family response regulator